MKSIIGRTTILITIVVMTSTLFALFGLTLPSNAQPKLTQESFPPNHCGDGKVDLILEDFNNINIGQILIFKADPAIASPVLSSANGCDGGQALSIEYDLTVDDGNGVSWVVAKVNLIQTVSITQATHIRIGLRGDNLGSHQHVEVKLGDGINLHAVTLESLTDLPVWRPIYIDLRKLSGDGSLDLANISTFEIGIVRCQKDCEQADEPSTIITPTNQYTGTIFIDDFALVDLKPGAAYRLTQTEFVTVSQNLTVAQLAASAILSNVATTGPAAGFVPAWFPETYPNYNSYVQAEALLVLVNAYQRTFDDRFRTAAISLTNQLIAQQITTTENSGAWYTSYHLRNNELQPLFRPLLDGEQGPQVLCDGSEIMAIESGNQTAKQIDGCMWVGNVGWIVIALDKMHRSGIYDSPAALKASIDKGGAWLSGQIGRETDYSNLISFGIEGNLSAYFGLLASDQVTQANILASGIISYGWDSTLMRMKTGANAADVETALDVAGSWGPTFLRTQCMITEALASQAYAATVLRTESYSSTVFGYGDIAGPFNVAVEFSAQGAVAGMRDSKFVMEEVYKLQRPSGAFPGASDHFYGGSLPPWNTTMEGVSPTAWVYFAAADVDPLWEAYAYRSGCTIFLPIILGPDID